MRSTRLQCALVGTVLLILLLLFPWQGALAASAKDYTAEQIDEQITLQDGGDLLINETITFHFGGDTFTYVFRELPTKKTDGITIQSAQMDGQELTKGSGENQVEIEQGDPIKVTWHFTPVTNSTHTFSLSYRAQGVVQKDGQNDLLAWLALPTEHEYNINSATVTVRYPSDAEMLGQPVLSWGNGTVEKTGDQQVTFHANNLGEDDSLEIRLSFRGGSLITSIPQWQQHEQYIAALNQGILPFSLGGGLVALLLGGLLVLLYRRKTLPDRASQNEEPTLLTSPPDALPPAIAGRLVKGDSQQARLDQALGTLFDLANREVLTIEETGRRGKGRFLVRQLSSDAELLPHEVGLWRIFFRTKRDRQEEIDFADVPTRFQQHQVAFTHPLQTEMEEAGLYDANRIHTRQRLLILTGLLLSIGVTTLIVALIVAAMTDLWIFIFPPIALIILGIVAWIAGANHPRLSDLGLQAEKNWRAFSHYLRGLTERNSNDGEEAEHFERYLPYAASFGYAQAWLNFYGKRQMGTVPRWFSPTHATVHTGTSDLGWMIAMGSIVHTHYQPPSSSGGSSAGSFAGGFSGGVAGGGGSGAG